MDECLGLLDGNIVKDDSQKADNAEVPVHLWDSRFQQAYTSAGYVLPGRWREALAGFRIGFSRLWKQRVLFSFWSHVKSRTRQAYHVTRDCMAAWCKPFSRPGIRIGRHKYAFDWIYRWTTGGRVAYCRAVHRLQAHPPIARDWEAARDAMSRVANSTWWEWDQGSRLLFWLWPADQLAWARDGQSHFLVHTHSVFTRPQAPAKTERDANLMKAKVDKVRQRRYIESGFVVSLLHMFYVPKGLDDIRMVYNGTGFFPGNRFCHILGGLM